MYNRACDIDGCNVWKCAESFAEYQTENSIPFCKIQTEAVVWQPTVKISETGFEPGDWRRIICGDTAMYNWVSSYVYGVRNLSSVNDARLYLFRKLYSPKEEIRHSEKEQSIRPLLLTTLPKGSSAQAKNKLCCICLETCNWNPSQ